MILAANQRSVPQILPNILHVSHAVIDTDTLTEGRDEEVCKVDNGEFCLLANLSSFEKQVKLDLAFAKKSTVNFYLEGDK